MTESVVVSMPYSIYRLLDGLGMQSGKTVSEVVMALALSRLEIDAKRIAHLEEVGNRSGHINRSGHFIPND